jgi:hypothetical protein
MVEQLKTAGSALQALIRKTLLAQAALLKDTNLMRLHIFPTMELKEP